MVSLKRVRSLRELTISATSSLIYSSCKSLNDQFSTASGIDSAYDDSECKKKVQALQEHFHSYIVRTLSEDVFIATLELHQKERIRDERILFHVLIHDEIHLRKFKMPSLPDMTASLYAGRVEFWLSCAPKLVNIVDLDLTDVSNCEQIVRAFCRLCTNLKVISLPATSVNTTKFVIQHCKNLKMLSHRKLEKFGYSLYRLALKNLEHLEYLDIQTHFSGKKIAAVKRQLKLKSLYLSPHKYAGEEVALDSCPDLQKLHIGCANCEINGRDNAIFRKLASSVLKVSRLELEYFCLDHCSAFDSFLSCKGEYITDITFQYILIYELPERLLEVLSKCKNLKRLAFKEMVWFLDEYPAPTRAVNISFPKLQVFDIRVAFYVEMTLRLTTLVLDHSEQLSSLLINTLTFEVMPQFFTPQRTRKLKKLRMFLYHDLSPELILQVVKSCPELIHLELGPLTEDTKLCVQKLREDAQTKNKEFTILELTSLDIANLLTHSSLI